MEPSQGSPADSDSIAKAWRRPMRLLLMCAWCGLAAGALELLIVLARIYGFQHGLSQRSPHLLWMAPASSLAIFALAVFPAACAIRAIPRIGRSVSRGFLGVLTVLSPMLAIPGLRAPACAMLAVGVAAWAVPAIRKDEKRSLARVRMTFPLLAALPVVVAVGVFARDAARDSKTTAPPPPPGAPNVLFVVMDTVRADATSLNGQTRGRDTTPNLRALASTGARFDHAISTSSWTLPSHASMFTGRWVRELAVGTDRPLDTRFPTLAEYLGKHGYATGGFVANATFCGREYGISRGFSYYEDVFVSPTEILRGSALGYLISQRLGSLLDHVYVKMGREPRHPLGVESARKDASRISRDALRWIDSQKERPFFAFLNYLDAHEPYLAPDAPGSRFGPRPRSLPQYRMLRDWLPAEGPPSRSPEDVSLSQDSYDDCIASLDVRLGSLFDALERGGRLKNTIVVVTSDHGEHFGEHSRDGKPIFGHGASLYQPEVHVPLVIAAPGQIAPGTIVQEPVCLRDLAATVVHLAGLDAGSPFPGRSLIDPPSWPLTVPSRFAKPPFLAELGLYSPLPAERRYLEPTTGLRRALFADGKVYHLHGESCEEFYDLGDDPLETRDLAHTEEAGLLEWYRDTLNAIAPAANLTQEHSDPEKPADP